MATSCWHPKDVEQELRYVFFDKGSKVTSFLSFRSAIADFVECSNAKEYARAPTIAHFFLSASIPNMQDRSKGPIDLSSINHMSVLAVRKSVTHIGKRQAGISSR